MSKLAVLPTALYERAVRCYFRRFGPEADFPSSNVSTFEEGIVILRNGARVLAWYAWSATDNLLRLIEERSEKEAQGNVHNE